MEQPPMAAKEKTTREKARALARFRGHSSLASRVTRVSHEACISPALLSFAETARCLKTELMN